MLLLEEALLTHVRDLLIKHHVRLGEKGLVCGEPVVTIQSPGPRRSSELKVEIYRDGQIDDYLEFFVYRDGEVNVTVEEAVRWLEQN